MHLFKSLLFVSISGISLSTTAAGIAVSNYPLYLITKKVTQGIEEPMLILNQKSGHSIQLKATDKQKINRADLVLWIGKAHEAGLAPLLKKHKNAIAMLDLSILNQLKSRNIDGKQLNSIDTHIWLDPDNAIKMGYYIASLRSQQQPANKTKYWANANRFTREMLKEKRKYMRSVSKTKLPYWAYHDAYQYIENSLDVKFMGALTSDSHIPPTIAQIHKVNQQRANSRKQLCLISEMQLNPRQTKLLTPIKVQVVNENFRNATSFTQAWGQAASKIKQCAA